MKGKKGLIMGVANERSIAWGISQKLAEAGAELAFTYLGDALKKRVIPLAEKLNSKVTFSCDVEKKEDVTKLFEDIKSQWGEIDFVVHAIAFSDKSELSGEYLNTTRENFLRSMLISCFSFTEVAKESSKVMKAGGSMISGKEFVCHYISYKNDKGYSTAIAYIQKTPEEDPYLEVHYRKVGKDFEQDKEEKIFPVQLREEAVTLYKTYLSKTILSND